MGLGVWWKATFWGEISDHDGVSRGKGVGGVGGL